MRRFIPAALIVILLACVGYSYVNAGSHKARADELQGKLDKAHAACARVTDMIPAESRPMWPADANPDERLTFVLDQKQRDAGSARLAIRFLEMPVAHRSSNPNSPRQERLLTQE